MHNDTSSDATHRATPRATPREGSPLPALIVRLAGLWILAGAGFKLFEGTPADLPPIVRNLPLELGLTYKLAIMIELSVAFLAFLRPRWAWLPLVGAFVAFDAILVGMLGEESCGCFGSNITLAPETMLAIDSTLLLGILASRPWSRMRRGGANVMVVAGAVALGCALPWLLDRQVSTDAGGGKDTGEVVADGRPVKGGWLELDIENWVGQDIHDTPLAKYVDFDALILEGLVVLYRNSCDHCADHLTQLAATEVGERMITLIRLEEPTDTEANRVVHLMPEGGFVQYGSLPDSITYILQTPGELVLENGKIVSATESAGSH